MGLAEEGAEQLTLDDAARAASATPAPTPRPEAPEVVEGSAPPGEPEPPVAAAAAQISST
jgi:hypothetical protein